MELKDLMDKIEALEGRATELTAKAEADDATTEQVAGFKALLEDEILPTIEQLKAEKAEAEREVEVKGIRTKLTSLEDVIKDLKKPVGFTAGVVEGKGMDSDNPYADDSFSFFADIKAANKGRSGAIERIEQATGIEGKAMTEGNIDGHTYGGYLVQPQVERQLVTNREFDNVLRGICSQVSVTTNSIELSQMSLGTTAGWVAELAEKPEATSLSLAAITASVFTAAGLATISNQLLADSNPAVDRLVVADLSKRLVALEEAAFLAGNGIGQPLGLLNTPGVQAVDVTNTDITNDAGLLVKLLDAIALVQEEHGQPSHILLHPRTWTKIIKNRDSDGIFTIGSPLDSTIADLTTPRTRRTGPSLTLWGVPVLLTNRLPSDINGNQSVAIVGDFSEALILDRQGITVDESPHVYFTSNQTVFRAEQRVGFTAARNPRAFAIVSGAGLANA